MKNKVSAREYSGMTLADISQSEYKSKNSWNNTENYLNLSMAIKIYQKENINSASYSNPILNGQKLRQIIAKNIQEKEILKL